MTQVVVDTDVVSFLFKNHPVGLLYDPELSGRVTLISFMTVTELERWAVQYGWSETRQRWLHIYLHRFTVVPSSPDLCRGWAEVTVSAQGAGRRIECADAWSRDCLTLRYTFGYSQTYRLPRRPPAESGFPRAIARPGF